MIDLTFVADQYIHIDTTCEIWDVQASLRVLYLWRVLSTLSSWV